MEDIENAGNVTSSSSSSSSALTTTESSQLLMAVIENAGNITSSSSSSSALTTTSTESSQLLMEVIENAGNVTSSSSALTTTSRKSIRLMNTTTDAGNVKSSSAVKKRPRIEKDTANATVDTASSSSSSTSYFFSTSTAPAVDPSATFTLKEAILKTKAMLHPNIEPHVLGPSRLTQFNDIVEKVKEAITTNQGLTIYACGLPGTGKTMIITKVVQEIQSLYPSTDVFRTAFIQGSVVDKDFLYFNLAAQLRVGPECVPSDKNFKILREEVIALFSKTKSRSKKPIPMTMVFIDEMDQAPYHELRTLINISSVQDSKLIIIGTGNNVSLTFELNLYTKPEIVIFKEYSKEDLMEILNARCFGKIINVHGFRFVATKLLGRKSGKLLVVLDYPFCFVFLLNFVPYTYLIGDARCAIQIMCQCLEMMIQRNVDRNPDFWKGILFLF